jgi:hypothetical protein
MLDWDAYIRCRCDLSRDNVVGMNVVTGEQQGQERGSKRPT